MNLKKQYKSEVFHRNSYDNEQKKGKSKLLIFGVIAVLIFASLFVRGCYHEKMLFAEKIEGVVQSKTIPVRNSFSILVYNNSTKLVKEYSCVNRQSMENVSMFEKMKIADSIYKEHNSGIMLFYRKEKGGYQFIDSFQVTRWY